MVASVLTVPVLYGLARAAFDRRTGLLAAALLALSPFAILFAPTAFTDPWLTLWLVLAAWAALARRPFVAGLLAALAVASKQQGVFVIPLVLMLIGSPGILSGWTAQPVPSTRASRRTSSFILYLKSSPPCSASRSSSARSPIGTACAGTTGPASGIAASAPTTR